MNSSRWPDTHQYGGLTDSSSNGYTVIEVILQIHGGGLTLITMTSKARHPGGFALIDVVPKTHPGSLRHNLHG